MKRKILWLVLSCLMVIALVLASCGLAPTEKEEEEEILPEVEKGPQYGGQLTFSSELGLRV